MNNGDLLIKFGFIIEENPYDQITFEANIKYENLQFSIDFSDSIESHFPPFTPSLPVFQLLRLFFFFFFFVFLTLILFRIIF